MLFGAFSFDCLLSLALFLNHLVCFSTVCILFKDPLTFANQLTRFLVFVFCVPVIILKNKSGMFEKYFMCLDHDKFESFMRVSRFYLDSSF